MTLSIAANKASSVTLIDAVPPAVYVWAHPVGDGDWQVPSSWAPARTMPAPNDILVFNIGGTTTATNVPTQLIGQLVVTNDTSVDLQSAAAIVLTITGGDGDDVAVDTGSNLNFSGSNALNCSLVTGTTAKIQGLITFSSSGTAAHRLTAVDAGAVVFKNGAVFKADNGFIGSPFGAGNLNSVIFEKGSSYLSISGGDPFGATEPNSVVVFKEGSLFSLRGDAVPSFSGRTYANFEMNASARSVFATGEAAMVIDDLTVTAGNLYLNLSGDPGHSIRGNITTASGTHLTFSSGTVRLNGTTMQTISCSGLQAADGGSTIAIDNPMGVSVNRSFAGWNLALINGKVNASASFFSVAGSVSRTNGYVIGYFQRLFFSPGSYILDVGSEDSYSPVQADVSAGNWPSGLTVKALQTAQPNILNPSKALSRYWEVYGQRDIAADLTFHYLDSDVPPTANESNFVIQRYNDGFTQPVGIVDTAANTFRVNGITTDFARDWTLAEPEALLPGQTAFDYDSDGKADLSVFRPSLGEWYYQRSLDGVVNGFQFGTSSDKPVPADFTGDGKTDIAFFRASSNEWYVLRSDDSTFFAFPFGAGGDIPVPADYDGDGKADAAVYRPSAQTWFILRSTGGVLSVPFGLSSDIPVPADYDGDGKTDVGIYRPGPGQWWNLRSSNNQVFAVTFGSPTDKPVVGDYTGDGKADVAFYRPSEGSWYVLRSEDFTYYAFPFGNSTDKPAPADYDGDGKYDAAIFRPSDTNWYIARSSGGVTIQQFGAAGDVPLPGAFVP